MTCDGWGTGSYNAVMLAERLHPSRIEVVEDRVAAILRRKTPGERLRMTFEMNRSVRRMLTSVIRGEHPQWTDRQISAEVARRMCGGAE
jgi:hypothetical protein